MDHFEMVEKLRQKANVSYEQAKAALEASDWDILDALVLLEGEGKVKSDEGAYTTEEKKFETTTQKSGNDFRGVMQKIGKFLKKAFDVGNRNTFIISRNGEQKLTLSLTELVLLIIFLSPEILIAMFIMLFFGFRYSFEGPDLNKKVNDAMGKAADAVNGAMKDKE